MNQDQVKPQIETSFRLNERRFAENLEIYRDILMRINNSVNRIQNTPEPEEKNNLKEKSQGDHISAMCDYFDQFEILNKKLEGISMKLDNIV